MARTIQFPRPARPNIDKILTEFLAEQEKRLKPRTFARYSDAIALLRDYLNGYACESLDKTESALFEHHHNAEGSPQRNFCELFAPEKITDNIGMFMDYFLVRKVVAGEDFLRQAGTVMRKLTKWLVENDCVPKEEGSIAIEKATESARDVPRARQAADILAQAAGAADTDRHETDEDYLEFDHFTIVRMKPGELWLEGFTTSADAIGPVPVPTEATQLLEKGWTISCSLGNDRGVWRMLEVANVYV